MSTILLQLPLLGRVQTLAHSRQQCLTVFRVAFCLCSENSEQHKDDAFREIIASCRSLSKYETNIKSALPQILSAIVAASFHIVIGISLAYSAILIPQLEQPGSDVPITKAQSSWIASIIVIMVPIGSLVAGVMMEFLGRLNTIKLAAVPCVAGWVAIALANNFTWIMVGRVLTGFACALGTSPAIVYITEVARPDMRGSLISSGPTLASLGKMGFAERKVQHKTC